ncbi:zinc finger MYND domain-containing protein, partial [Aspergillus ibericus CBS 121593]
CGHCGQTRNLRRCSGCQVMFYCSKDHQKAHRSAHKSACHAVARARGFHQRVAVPITRACGGTVTLTRIPQDVRDNREVFQGWMHDYLFSKYFLTEVMDKINTRQAVQERLDLLLSLVHVFRADEVGTRWKIPALLIRLQRDQESYDFMKWFCLAKKRTPIDEMNPALPFLDMKNADAFEDVIQFTSEWKASRLVERIHTMLALTLLKVRLVLDLRMLETVGTAIGETILPEIHIHIQAYVVESSVISKDRALLARWDHGVIIAELEKQIRVLMEEVQRFNEHIWSTLVDGPFPLAIVYTSGSPEEAVSIMTQCHAAWSESPGAIPFIRERSAG